MDTDRNIAVKIVFVGNQISYTHVGMTEDEAEILLQDLFTHDKVILCYYNTGKIACVVITNNVAYAVRLQNGG
jgi:hypothetical protein